MQEPQVYDAQTEAMKSLTLPKAGTGQTEAIDEEALLVLQEDRGQIVTDLKQWATFMPKDRVTKAAMIADMTWEQFDPDRAIGKNRRKRYLMWIIFREVFHPRGCADAAREAFRGLFPEKGK